jgi:hypothetical protein
MERRSKALNRVAIYSGTEPDRFTPSGARASSASKAQNEHFKKPDRNHKHCERYRIVLKPIPI